MLSRVVTNHPSMRPTEWMDYGQTDGIRKGQGTTLRIRVHVETSGRDERLREYKIWHM